MLFRAIAACLAFLWVLAEGVISLIAERPPVFVHQELDWFQYALLLTLIGVLAWVAVKRWIARRRVSEAVDKE
ncbi:hypothetical protein KAU45_08295 [bacterium]|nr:hypothetical protein [bacterium]